MKRSAFVRYLASSIAAAAFAPALIAATVPCTWTTRQGLAPIGIDFGTYLVSVGGSLAGSTPFRVDCKANSPTATVALSIGQYSSNWSSRLMQLAGTPGVYVGYQLFTDAGATWGDATGGTTKTYDPQGRDRIFNDTIFATMPALVDPYVGRYNDSVRGTLAWAGGSEVVTIPITVYVQPECTVSSFKLDFKAYDPVVANASTNLDASAPIAVKCTRGTKVTIQLGQGTGPAGAWRQMSGPAPLNYQLYRSSGRNPGDEWTTAQPLSLTSTSWTADVGFVVYGRIPAGQDVPIGGYNDTVVATVNY